MAVLIRTKSWATILPAPMFMWPTSEFPMVPSGSPTASPQHLRVVFGHSSMSLSRNGVLAAATALPSSDGLIPQPSSIIKILTGLFSEPIVIIHICFCLPTKFGEINRCGITPKSFKVVKCHGIGFKDMDDQVPEIKQRPLAFLDPFCT